MAATHPTVKVLERCAITPLPTPGSSAPPPLPLTLFDIVWYVLGPVQRVYFYSIPSTASEFLEHHLPSLKRSLSLALRRFYPLAGRLIRPAASSLPSFCHLEGRDSVELTVAESDDDFAVLASDVPKAALRLHNLVPRMSSPPLVDDKGSAVSAFQVTIFPHLQKGPVVGIAIGVSALHAAADGCSIVHFVKTWAAMCRGEPDGLIELPCYDRTAVKQRTDEMAETLMAQFDEMSKENTSINVTQDKPAASDLLRATFRLTKTDIELLRQRVSATASSSLRYSTFSLATGLVWSAQIKARGHFSTATGDDESSTEWFVFPCNLRGRFDPPVPQSYFGNLVGGCLVGSKRADLIGGNGLEAAAAVVQDASVGLRHAEGVRKATDLAMRTIDIAVRRPLSMAGSPRLGVYRVDFGWGMPRKVEVVSIDTTSAFSLAESRDEEDGGIEVGVVLPPCEMQRFAELFADALHVCGTGK